MATIETNADARLFGSYQGERELSEGFALRFPKDPDWWRAGDAFTSDVFTRPFSNDEATETPVGATVLGPDEATREAVSFASAPVVIALTDEQAEQFLRFQRRGAPPQ